jgi:hypothetical protein
MKGRTNPSTASQAVRRGEVTCRHMRMVITAYSAQTIHEKTSLGFDTEVFRAKEMPSAILSSSKSEAHEPLNRPRQPLDRRQLIKQPADLVLLQHALLNQIHDTRDAGQGEGRIRDERHGRVQLDECVDLVLGWVRRETPDQRDPCMMLTSGAVNRPSSDSRKPEPTRKYSITTLQAMNTKDVRRGSSSGHCPTS